MSFAPSASDELTFNGHNWEDLNRIIALAKFKFIVDNTSFPSDREKSAYVAGSYSGAALDWIALAVTNSPLCLDNFDGFITATREAFGVADNNINALNRRKLDDLQFGSDVPVFFAEFDRLCSVLSITGHATKVAMVEGKLPSHIKQKFADQALSFENYETMRERLNMMWALSGKPPTKTKGKSRCGNCGKKGHTASDCRSEKK